MIVSETFPRASTIQLQNLSLQYHQLEGLVQDCSNSIANALELLQSCTEPSIWPILFASRNGDEFCHWVAAEYSDMIRGLSFTNIVYYID